LDTGSIGDLLFIGVWLVPFPPRPTISLNRRVPGLSFVSGVGRGNGGKSDGSRAALTSSPDVSATPSAIAGVQRERFVNAAEIVEANPQRNCRMMVLKFLAETVREPCATPHLHP